MRKRMGRALVAGLIAIAGLATNASAGITIDLLWVGRNGVAIAPTRVFDDYVRGGDTLDLAVMFTNDIPLSGYQFSLRYDFALSGIAPTAEQWAGVGLSAGNTSQFRPLGPLFVYNDIGLITQFNSFISNLSSTLRLPPGSYQIGTVHFALPSGNHPVFAGIDAGLFDAGDGAGDANFNYIGEDAFRFNSAFTSYAPEPGTAALLGMGLVGLALASRRDRA